MKTRRTFLKGLLGFVGGFIGLDLVKAGITSPTKNKGKIQIEYLYLLGGTISPWGIQRQDPNQSLTMVIEAPFVIYWEGRKGNRKGCPMGNIEINLIEIGDKTPLLRNIDTDKLTGWIIPHLTALPKSRRIRKYIVGEMAWAARISLETVETLQKD